MHIGCPNVSRHNFANVFYKNTIKEKILYEHILLNVLLLPLSFKLGKE